MAKSDARFEYRAKFGRETHNLGEPFGFTAAPGMLIPVFEDIATPGDSYYIQHDLEYLRTLPLLAPAMIDVKVHLESFFVPFQMIYQPIEQTLFSTLTPQSSFYGLGAGQIGSWLNKNFPLLDYPGIVSEMINQNMSFYHSQLRSDAFRLADMLGLNADNFAKDSNYGRYTFTPKFFPWQLLTYHTIYNYFYRLDDKSKFTNVLSNYDNCYNDINGNSPNEIFTIHQRAWDFDYYTSMYRSPIVSDASMQNILPPDDYSDLMGSSFNQIGIDAVGNYSSSNDGKVSFAGAVGGSYSSTQVQGTISTSIIRQLFANEKLAMITGRARKTYDSQVLAHFGVQVPHDPKHDIAFIGRDTYELKIGEVTSLASTSDAGLGDLAGKGWLSGKSKGHKFTCPCHGVIMTIFSVEPIKRYYGGFDRINTLTSAFGIPTPEFDRLGNVPMYRFEAGERAGSGTVTDYDIIGWKERYYQYKRRHPKVSLAFQNGTVHQGYNSYGAYMLASTPFGAVTSTNNNTARPDLESRFYIDRNAMDFLFLQPYIGNWQNGLDGEETSENWNQTPWLAYVRDPFIVDLDMKVKKVSWLSKDGEPVYNF